MSAVALDFPFPAHAGLNRDGTGTADTSSAVPRARGAEPKLKPPCWRQSNPFPAHAGLNRERALEALRIVSVPRARGAEPRLWVHENPAPVPFPAHAGLNRPQDLGEHPERAVPPRTRG